MSKKSTETRENSNSVSKRKFPKDTLFAVVKKNDGSYHIVFDEGISGEDFFYGVLAMEDFVNETFPEQPQQLSGLGGFPC